MQTNVDEKPTLTISARKICADGRVIDYGVVCGGSRWDRIKNKIISVIGRR